MLDSNQIVSHEFDSATDAEKVEQVSGGALFTNVVKGATAATATVLAASQVITEVQIKALKTNTGVIYIGDSSVSSTKYGVELDAGQTVILKINNLDLVYLSAAVAGEGVSYIAY